MFVPLQIAQRDPHDNDMGGFDQGFAQPPAVVSPPRAAAAPAKSFDMDIDEGLTADTEDGGDEARDLGIGTSKSGGARKARKPRKSFFDDQVVTGAPKRKGKEKVRFRSRLRAEASLILRRCCQVGSRARPRAYPGHRGGHHR